MDQHSQPVDLIGLLANWIQILTFVWAIGASFFARWLYGKNKKKQEGLLQALVAAEAQLVDMRAELEDHRRFDPREWPAVSSVADIPSGQHNPTERAFELSAPFLAQTCRELADLYGGMLDAEAPAALQSALRFMRLEALLQTPGSDRLELLAELEASSVFQNGSQGKYIPDEDLLSSSKDDKVNTKLVEGYVSWLVTKGREQVPGNSQMFELLLRRARRLSMMRLGDTNKLTLISRQLWAEALSNVGEDERALDEFEAILPTIKSIFGPSDQRVLDVMFGQQHSLRSLGQWTQADRMNHKILRLAERIDRTKVLSPSEIEENMKDLQRVKDWVLRRHNRQE
jgi:hypothetical protein